jgi:hypothetical protein
MQNLITTTFLALTLLIGASSAEAQSRRQLAKQYTELPAVQAMMREMFSANTMYEQFSVGMPDHVKITNAQKRRIGEALSSEMMKILPEFNKVMIKESARAFTKDELKAMIAFYSTPEGSAILAKTTSFMSHTMRGLQPSIERVQEAMIPQMIEILRD